MSISFSDLVGWRSSGVSAASTALRADVRALEGARDTLEANAVPASWVGIGSVFARIRRTSLVASMTAHVDALTAFERAVYQAVSPVAAIERDVADIRSDAAAQQFSISPDGTVTDTSPPRTFESVRAAEHHTEQRVAARDALVARIEAVLDRAHEVDSALVAARPRSSFSAGGPEDVVDPQVAREWEQMTDDERRALVEHISEELAREAGVDDFEVRIEDLEDKDGDGTDDDPQTDSFGSWSEDERVLRIDEGNLDDPKILATVAHEVRHAQQEKEIDDLPFWPWEDYDPPPGITEEQVEEWKDNFEDYKTSEDDGFEAYHDQPVEEDAREAGSRYLDELDAEELERLREGAR